MFVEITIGYYNPYLGEEDDNLVWYVSESPYNLTLRISDLTDAWWSSIKENHSNLSIWLESTTEGRIPEDLIISNLSTPFLWEEKSLPIPESINVSVQLSSMAKNRDYLNDAKVRIAVNLTSSAGTRLASEYSPILEVRYGTVGPPQFFYGVIPGISWIWCKHEPETKDWLERIISVKDDGKVYKYGYPKSKPNGLDSRLCGVNHKMMLNVCKKYYLRPGPYPSTIQLIKLIMCKWPIGCGCDPYPGWWDDMCFLEDDCEDRLYRPDIMGIVVRRSARLASDHEDGQPPMGSMWVTI